jgi:hypothetical protein
MKNMKERQNEMHQKLEEEIDLSSFTWFYESSIPFWWQC